MDNKLLWGTLEMLILRVVADAPTYGYRITQTVLADSNGQFDIKEGSLYPALHRMERRGELKSYWVEQEGERRRKYYKITAAGTKALRAREKDWTKFVGAVQGVLGAERALA
jgi:transcriptional regulator